MFQLRIDRTPGALVFIFFEDGVGSFLRALLSVVLVRLLPIRVRIGVWERHTVCRESAAEWVAQDTAELLPVLHSLVVGGALLVGGSSAQELVNRDFISIVRKAAFRRGCAGGDPTELHQILDELSNPRIDQSG